MSNITVLLCDDNKAIHESLAEYLKDNQFNVISGYTGEEALEQLKQHSVDVVILDIMLPGINGYEVCREIRKTSDVYIIMLSAKAEEFDRVVGLEIGADDYVAKPFSPREIKIRIKRAMDRLQNKNEIQKLRLEELTILPESYQVFVGENEINVSPKEVEALTYMVANAGRVLTREHILNAVWKFDYFGDTRVIDTMIKNLRQKIINPEVNFTIRTVYGVGYVLEKTDRENRQ